MNDVHQQQGIWSSGMIHALGVRGPKFNSRNASFYFIGYIINQLFPVSVKIKLTLKSDKSKCLCSLKKGCNTIVQLSVVSFNSKFNVTAVSHMKLVQR